MPPRPSQTRRTTLTSLRLKGKGLADGVLSKYVDSPHFTTLAVGVAGVDALLTCGAIERDRPDWVETVELYTGRSLDAGNKTAASALLIPINDRVIALTYGMGHLLLNPDYVEQGFGLRFAVRALDPDEVRAVTRRVLEQRARIDRNSVPAGQRVSDYAIEHYGEVVSKLVGRSAVDLSLAGTKGASARFTVRAADSLNLPLPKDAAGLVEDLGEVVRIADGDAPHEELQFIEQLKVLKSRDPVIRRLNETLAERLRAADTSLLALQYPVEEEDLSEAGSYRVTIPGASSAILQELTVHDFCRHLSRVDASQLMATMRSGRVQAFSDADGHDACSRATPLTYWLSAQVDSDGRRYFLQQGKWYAVGDDYVEYLRGRVAEILSVPAPLMLPSRNEGEHEGPYNERVAQSEHLTHMDKRMVRTAAQPRGFEACDLLGAQSELIHVKFADRSSSLSHLFAQAAVSADQLILDAEARQKFARIAAEAPQPLEVSLSWRPQKVVYAIGIGRALTPETLFTFAQVVLVRAVDNLRLKGIEVSILPIAVTESS